MTWRRLLSLIGFWFTFYLGTEAQAFFLDFNLFYYSDAFKVANQYNSTRMFGDFAIGLSADKKGYWVVGWNVGYTSAADQATTTTTYTVIEMGPKFGMFFDKDLVWSFWLTYNLNVTGTYSSGSGSTETWRGTSLKAELGVTPQLSADTYAGVKLIYHSETFLESLIGSSSYTQVAYTRAFIYPALTFSMRY